MTTEAKEPALHTYEKINAVDVDRFGQISLTRITVPGGWIYDFGNRAVFVPEPFELIPAMLEEFTPGPVDV